MRRLLGRQGRHRNRRQNVRMRDEDMEKVAHELAQHSGPQHKDFKIQVTGRPAINAALNKIVLQDTATLATYSGLTILLMLILLFRHQSVWWAQFVVTLAVVWTLGFMAAINYGMTILSVILPSFYWWSAWATRFTIPASTRDLRKFGVKNGAAIARP